MEALLFRAVVLTLALTSLGASYRTTNFIVEAPTKELAVEIGREAERFRRELAIDWLGAAMPNWSQPCPIVAQVAPNLGAGGATSFLFDRGEVYGWKMGIQGSRERLLDSVLPHEITHTIFATHFRRPLPRWADEGACTTVEHISEKTKQQHMLISFLRTGRGIAFSDMFAMKEYPHDVMPLYSQGFSLARFLLDQGGKKKYLDYISAGLKREDWSGVTKQFYGYNNLAALQDAWLKWVKQGSPAMTPRDDRPLDKPLEVAAASTRTRPRPESNLIYRGQSSDDTSTAARAPAPVRSGAARGPQPNQVVANDVPQGRVAVGARRGPYDVALPEEPVGAEPALVASNSAEPTASDFCGEPAAASPAGIAGEEPARAPVAMAALPDRQPTAQKPAVLLEWKRKK